MAITESRSIRLRRSTWRLLSRVIQSRSTGGKIPTQDAIIGELLRKDLARSRRKLPADSPLLAPIIPTTKRATAPKLLDDCGGFVD